MTRKRLPALGMGALICCVVSTGYAQQPAALVITRGTLIDGNGGAPVHDVVVVIEGNKIASVSRRGQASYSPKPTTINANGKFVLPGLWTLRTPTSGTKAN